MRLNVMLVAASWAVVVGSACLEIDPVEGQFACQGDGDCLAGWSCRPSVTGNICVQGDAGAGGGSDAATETDASMDSVADVPLDAPVDAPTDSEVDAAADSFADVPADSELDVGEDPGAETDAEVQEPGILTGVWIEVHDKWFLVLEQTGSEVTGYSGSAPDDEANPIKPGGSFDGFDLKFTYVLYDAGELRDVHFDLGYLAANDELIGTSQLETSDGLLPKVDVRFVRYEP